MAGGAGGVALAWLAFGCASAGQVGPAATQAGPVVRTEPSVAVVPVGAREAEPVTTALPNPADEIVARVDAFYDDVRTFKATFRQRSGLLEDKGSTGSVTFEQPNKMSWRYRNGNRVLSDGRLVRIYEAENRQLYEVLLARTQYAGALSFLIHRGGFERYFELSKLDSARLKFANGYAIQAQPRFATTAYERLIFYIDATSYQVRRVLVIDAQGNRNRYDFKAVEVNSPIAAGEFEFTVPLGTKTIRL